MFRRSWGEMGKYDIPAMMQKIMDKTGQEKIFYIGHSMGTTGFMVMANDRPDMLDHIHLASLLAPVAYVDHMKSPIRYLAPFSNSVGVSKNFWFILRGFKLEFPSSGLLTCLVGENFCPATSSWTFFQIWSATHFCFK